MINETAVEGLVLIGLDGDDTFNVPGNHPYSTFNIQGGNPSASDVVNFTASGTVANLVTTDFGANTVQEATFAAITLSGIELLNANANGHSLTSIGTSGNDALDITPTGAAAATIRLLTSAPSVGRGRWSMPQISARRSRSTGWAARTS